MMIQKLDQLKENYARLPHLEDALICLAKHGNTPAPAKFNFPGGYMMLQEGTTKDIDEGDFEAHRSYLDIQVLLKGTEIVEWNDILDLKLSMPYDQEKDKEMYIGRGARMTFAAGTSYVCWPEDGHKACRHIGQPNYYRKAIIKLAI